MPPRTPRQSLTHVVLLMAIALTALFNGFQVSPIYDPASYYVVGFMPNALRAAPTLLLNLTSMFIVALTVMVAGIPAALYERARRSNASSTASLAIWLVAAIGVTVIVRLIE
jgi:ABC-type transport system involved in multi-copper enzyme maturation permease subunit